MWFLGGRGEKAWKRFINVFTGRYVYFYFFFSLLFARNTKTWSDDRQTNTITIIYTCIRYTYIRHSCPIFVQWLYYNTVGVCADRSCRIHRRRHHRQPVVGWGVHSATDTVGFAAGSLPRLLSFDFLDGGEPRAVAFLVTGDRYGWTGRCRRRLTFSEGSCSYRPLTSGSLFLIFFFSIDGKGRGSKIYPDIRNWNRTEKNRFRNRNRKLVTADIFGQRFSWLISMIS